MALTFWEVVGAVFVAMNLPLIVLTGAIVIATAATLIGRVLTVPLMGVAEVFELCDYYAAQRKAHIAL